MMPTQSISAGYSMNTGQSMSGLMPAPTIGLYPPTPAAPMTPMTPATPAESSGIVPQLQ